jgi:hypothetical protein
VPLFRGWCAGDGFGLPEAIDQRQERGTLTRIGQNLLELLERILEPRGRETAV